LKKKHFKLTNKLKIKNKNQENKDQVNSHDLGPKKHCSMLRGCQTHHPIASR